MSISEARRQVERAHEVTNLDHLWTDQGIANIALGRVLAHGFSAVVEVLASNAPYDGDLNAIRVPVTMLRQISLDLIKDDLEDVGLEDFILAVRARLKSSAIDNRD